MIRITKTELTWMLNHVKRNRDESMELKDYPGQRFAALHALEYENMAALAEKLERIIKSDCKRIATGW